MIVELVRDPRGYFEERIKYPQLRNQVVIVAIAGLVASLWRIALIPGLGAASVYVDDVMIILTIANVLALLVIWFVVAVVMQVIAGVLGGGGTTGDLLKLTGYGFLPIIVSGLVWSIGYYWTLSGAAAPPAPRQAGFQFSYVSYTEYLNQVTGDPLLLGALAVGSIFVVAAGYLWMHAVQVSTGLDRNRAVVAVGPAVALVIIYVFFPVL